MDEQNYEEIRKQHQDRLREEKKRRRRKVLLLYCLIIAAVLAAAALGYGARKSWQGKVRDTTLRQTASSGAGEGTASASEAAASVADGETVSAADGESASAADRETVSAADKETASAAGGETAAGGTAADGGTEGAAEDKETSWRTGHISRFLSWLVRLFAGEEKGLLTDPGQLLRPDGRSSGKGEDADSAAGGDGDDQAGTEPDTLEGLLAAADRLAAGYDYDSAIALIEASSAFSGTQEAREAVSRYEEIKAGLVEQDVTQVTHVFFHSLIVDTDKAFDGDSESNGYNQVMTTKDEFEKILDELYARGYVLVRLHDLAHEETDEDGDTVMVKGTILLPEGKQAMVMSQDDVCYYPYMEGDGFASRIVIGEDGKPTCEMALDDGSVVTGEYDLVPILERFIEEHPDFSYRGARAVLALTGYEGILGYRTASSYEDSPTYEKDREQAAAVAQCLRDNGWELASHSWGHRYLGQLDMDSFKADVDKWESEVESLIGPTDIILYSFGDDVSDWHPYTEENEKYIYLHEKGFRYFCTVDSSRYWVQIGDDYFRQGRRNLDGYRIWQDIAAAQEGGNGVRHLEDLFQAEDVFDPARPTPVVWD